MPGSGWRPSRQNLRPTSLAHIATQARLGAQRLELVNRLAASHDCSDDAYWAKHATDDSILPIGKSPAGFFTSSATDVTASDRFRFLNACACRCGGQLAGRRGAARLWQSQPSCLSCETASSNDAQALPALTWHSRSNRGRHGPRARHIVENARVKCTGIGQS